jgi:hypothetical protein
MVTGHKYETRDRLIWAFKSTVLDGMPRVASPDGARDLGGGFAPGGDRSVVLPLTRGSVRAAYQRNQLPVQGPKCPKIVQPKVVSLEHGSKSAGDPKHPHPVVQGGRS